MNKYQMSADNLSTVMHSSVFDQIYSDSECKTVFYDSILCDDRENFRIKCEIDSSWKTIEFQLLLPVSYDDEIIPELSSYIKKVNQIYGYRGLFELFDEDLVSLSKEISFSSFYISVDSIYEVIYSLKANAFDFIDTLRYISNGDPVPNDKSIASSLYYEMYPEKRIDDTDEPTIDEDDEQDIDLDLDIDMDDLISRIDAWFEKNRANNANETALGDTIEALINDEEETDDD